MNLEEWLLAGQLATLVMLLLVLLDVASRARRIMDRRRRDPVVPPSPYGTPRPPGGGRD